MKNKFIVLIAVCALIMALASCDKGNDESTTSSPETTLSETTTEETTIGEDLTEEETTEEETTQTEESSVVLKKATVTVEQVDDIAGEYGTVFNASTEEYAFYAVVRTDVKISDVNVLGLTFVDADDNGNITFEKKVLHTVEEIRPDFNLSVHLTADGSIPAYGISYTDTDGEVKAFSVNMSGEDGSLYLSEIN